MAWSKLKNIILVILLTLNLILLSVVGYREHQTAAYEKSALTSTLALLASNGIQIREGKLPANRSLDAVQLDGVALEGLDGTRPRAAALLGTITRTEDGAGGMRTTYFGKNGTGEFSSSGRFTFTLIPGTVPLDGPNAAQQGLDLLADLGFQGQLARMERSGGTLTLAYYQLWDGVPVFTCQPILTCENGYLLRIEGGQQVFGAATVMPGDTTLSLPTVLLHFLTGMTQGGYVCSEITDMTLGYESTVAPPFNLTPVWSIQTDTGEYRVNAVTGKFATA